MEPGWTKAVAGGRRDSICNAAVSRAMGSCRSARRTFCARCIRATMAMRTCDAGISASAASMLAANAEIGRAHDCTQVTTAQFVCRILLDTKENSTTTHQTNTKQQNQLTTL